MPPTRALRSPTSRISREFLKDKASCDGAFFAHCLDPLAHGVHFPLVFLCRLANGRRRLQPARQSLSPASIQFRGIFTLTKQPQNIDRTGQAGGEALAHRFMSSSKRSSVRISDEMIRAGASVALESWGLVSTAYLVEQVFLAMWERMEYR
jgi:hypothetical protein